MARFSPHRIGFRQPLARLSLLLVLLCAGACTALAEEAKPLKGVALVIGNGDYGHIAKLANPPNDARAIEEMLNGLGFDTTMVSDRNARRLKRDLEGFVEDAEGADVAVIYYSGHGIEAGGENYLVPVDADLSALEEAGEKLVPLSEIVEELKHTVPVTIVMLDACRSDPFPPGALVKNDPGDEGKPIGRGGLGEARGAVSLKTTGPADESFGTVIGFAAEPGKVALDGEPGGNSPYAAAILRHLSAMGGAEFGTVMRMVAEEVYLKTAGRQRPWVNESLRRLLYFGDAPPAPEGAEGDILTERRTLLLTIADLPQASRARIETIAATGGVPMDGLYAMLAALGVDAPKDPAELDRLMRGQADRLKAMMDERATLKNPDPEIARLSALADKALAEGALATAIKLLADAKARVVGLDASVDQAEADLAKKRIEFAAVYARSAEAHALAFDYLAASGDYAQAYDQIARWDDRLAWTYKQDEAEALRMHGDFQGDNAAMSFAVEAAKAALVIAAPMADRLPYTTTQNTLGNALWRLGERETATRRIDEAIVAFRAALDGVSRETEPLYFAQIQNNLGNALTTLGMRRADTAKLEEALIAFEAAVTIFVSTGDRESWATTQSNVGKTLLALGNMQNSVDRLKQAGGAFQAALDATQRETEPLVWGTAANNVGTAYQALGRHETDPNARAGYFLYAETAYRQALGELTRERVPLQWASVQGNIADTQEQVGFLQKDKTLAANYFHDAAETQSAALEEVTRERDPYLWARMTARLARLNHIRAENETGGMAAIALLREAANLYARALQEMPRELSRSEWAQTQSNLGHALLTLSELEAPAEARIDLVAAIAARRAALEEYSADANPLGRAAELHDLGITLMRLGALEDGTASYEQAEAVYREEEGLRSREAAPVNWARAQAGIGDALRAIGLKKHDKAILTEARRLIQEAWDVIRPIDNQYDTILAGRIGEIETALAALN